MGTVVSFKRVSDAQLAQIVDLAGYGSANFFEGVGQTCGRGDEYFIGVCSCWSKNEQD